MKKCIKCKRTKPLSFFQNRKLNKDGKLNTCRFCSRKRQREIYNSDIKKKYYKIKREDILIKNGKRRILSKCRNKYNKDMTKRQMIDASISLIKNINLFKNKDYQLVRDTQMKLFCTYIDKYNDWYLVENKIENEK